MMIMARTKIYWANYQYEEVNCNICGSNNYEKISQKGHHKIPVSLVLCRQCGLGYLNPRWDKASYENFYQFEYDRIYRPHLNNLKFEDVVQPKNPIIVRFEKFDQWPDRVVNVLDIGSGEGLNLDAVKSKFSKCELFAIEPSEASKKELERRGVKLLSNDVDDSWDKNYQNYFDIIIMRHVLEHLLDPATTLAKLKGVLNENGVLYIAVPDNLRTTRQEGWLRVVHTYYFNRFSLSCLLQRLGFKIIQMKEGDEINQMEIFLFAVKGNNEEKLQIYTENFALQRKVFNEVIAKARVEENLQIVQKVKQLFFYLPRRIWSFVRWIYHRYSNR